MSAELIELIADVAKRHVEPAAGELPACWDVLVDLGLPLIGIPLDRGGSGGSLADLLVVARELGRHGVGTPLIEAAVANWALTCTGRAVPTGLRTVTLDRSRAVPWARHAVQVVLADESRIAVATLNPAAIRADVSVAGEPVDEVDYFAIEVETLGAGAHSEGVAARLGALRAAALTGAIDGAYRLTRSYVTAREQFGQPLIRIPAVATNLARMRAGLLLCQAALERAGDGRLATAAAARVLAGRTATEVARLAHQLHGAMGITDEYRLHHFTTRLWAWRDADRDEREWSVLLGRLACSGGETGLWHHLTS